MFLALTNDILVNVFFVKPYISDLLPDDVILQPFMRIGCGLSSTDPSMSPRVCIALILGC